MNINTKYIKIASCIFLLFFIIGFIGTYLYGQTIDFDKSKANQFIINKVTFSSILINNLIVCGIAILGVITFRLSSSLVLIGNSLVLGVVLGANFVATGRLLYFVLIVLPHAIFEIPAIIIACSIGFEGFSYFKKYTFKEKGLNCLLVIGLLVVAALVEVNISTLFI